MADRRGTAAAAPRAPDPEPRPAPANPLAAPREHPTRGEDIRREPHAHRPFRVPLYPLLPLLFCATCAYMLWSSLSYVYSQSLGGLNAAWIGVAVLAVGLLLLVLIRRREHRQMQRNKSLMPFESR